MSGPRNSSSPAEASAGAMIEKENERLSPLSLTRIMVGEFRAIAQKLCVSIQGGAAGRNEHRHARRDELDQVGDYSGVEARVPNVQNTFIPADAPSRAVR